MKRSTYQLTDTATFGVLEEYASLSDASHAPSEIRDQHGSTVFDHLALSEVEDGTCLKAFQGNELLELAHPSSVSRSIPVLQEAEDIWLSTG